MPQIGWSEILVIILVAIIVIGPKDLPIVLRKFIQIKNGIKNYVNSFQKGIDDIVHGKNIAFGIFRGLRNEKAHGHCRRVACVTDIACGANDE